MSAVALRYEGMPRTPSPENHKETRLGQLLKAALAAKTAELEQTGIPGTYSYRSLADDAGINYSYVGKIIHGINQPSREIVEAIIRALDPYLPADETLMAAGYMPRSGRLRALLRRFSRYPLDRVEGIDRTLRRVYFNDDPLVEDNEDLFTFKHDNKPESGAR